MIDRYTHAEMKRVWSKQHEWETMLEIEVAACEAMAELGYIPRDAAMSIRENASFDLRRIEEIEKEVHHDLIAFLTAVAERVGDDSKYIHQGLTSSDIKDTALALLMKEAADIILRDLAALRASLRRRAAEHKYTPCIGRTHGIHAEVMTLGMKFALWMDETHRNIERITRARDTIAVGKLSGAVGTYAETDPRIEEAVCDRLGIARVNNATQVVQRDRHAEYMTALAITASSLEKFATEVRSLQRTDIREVEERFADGQKGSSAMPHKRNPITCERISGLARIVRGNAIASLENIALWHERDLTHSSVERIIIPDSTVLVDYCLRRFTKVADDLLVYPQTMTDNINKTGGLIFSQRLLLAIVDKGILREDAYRWVQRNAMKTWTEGADFETSIMQDEDIRKYLTESEIKACFDLAHYLRHIDTIMAGFGL